MAVEFIADDAALDAIATSAGQRILLNLARKVQQVARGLTTPAKGPAKPNQPPNEHFGDLDRSIQIGITSSGEVVVGSVASIVGERGHVLEFAGTFDPAAGRDTQGRFLKGHASRTAPSGAKWAHPFMRPAFEAALTAGSLEADPQFTSTFS